MKNLGPAYCTITKEETGSLPVGETVRILQIGSKSEDDGYHEYLKVEVGTKNHYWVNLKYIDIDKKHFNVILSTKELTLMNMLKEMPEFKDIFEEET